MFKLQIINYKFYENWSASLIYVSTIPSDKNKITKKIKI